MLRSLELKIPPAIVFLLVALLMYVLSVAVPAATWPVPGRGFIGVFMLAWGCLLVGMGISAFRAHKTSFNPGAPASATMLVTRGIYRRTRNPMYLGLLFVLIGWAVYLSNLVALLGLPLFVLYMNRFQIQAEERVLHEKFGNAYYTYTVMVRRWL